MTFVVAAFSATSAALGGGLLGGAAGVLAAGTVGAAEGAALGAGKAAISHEDVGKGALMGAATGAVGGGLAPGVGAAGSLAGAAGTTANTVGQVAAGGVAGAAANAAGAAAGGKDIGKAALIGGITGGALAGANAAAGAPATSGPVDTPASGASLTMEQPGAMDVLGSKLADVSGGQMLQNAGILGAGAVAESAMNKTPQVPTNVNPKLAPGLTAAMRAKQIYDQGPMGGLGSIGMAQGGQVPVRDGAYIIPADVVSALGNGSSKAGAEYLRRLMEEVKVEATKRYGLGAARRAVA